MCIRDRCYSSQSLSCTSFRFPVFFNSCSSHALVCDFRSCVCLYIFSLLYYFFFFLMIRRPPRSTLDRSSAASDVYKRQLSFWLSEKMFTQWIASFTDFLIKYGFGLALLTGFVPVSYTHLRAHETVLDLVCRLLLEKKKKKKNEDTR